MQKQPPTRTISKLERGKWRQQERQTSKILRKKTKQRRCFQLLAGGSAVDIVWIHQFEELCKRLYIYDHDEKTVRHPHPTQDVPWPIIWSLASYHKNHIFVGGTKPNLEHLRQEVQQFIHKTKWKWIHRHDQSPPPSIKPPRQEWQYCWQVVDSGLQCWLHELHRESYRQVNMPEIATQTVMAICSH